jgi:hypothetical protein
MNSQTSLWTNFPNFMGKIFFFLKNVIRYIEINIQDEKKIKKKIIMASSNHCGGLSSVIFAIIVLQG